MGFIKNSEEQKTAASFNNDFKIIAVTDRKACRINFLKRIEELAEAGISSVILREKDIEAEEYEALAVKVMKICENAGVEFIPHSFTDCAVNMGCRSIHLPLPILRKESKRLVFHMADKGMVSAGDGSGNDLSGDGSGNDLSGDDLSGNGLSGNDLSGKFYQISKIGSSVHSPEEALEVRKLGASYVTAGHVFVTDCKKGLAPRGVKFLKEIVSIMDIPVYGIGGINEGNIGAVKAAGAAGACIMSGFMTVDNVKEYMEKLREGLDGV